MIKVMYTHGAAFEEDSTSIREYSSIEELLEDAIGWGYVAGLNDCGIMAKVIEDEQEQ